MAGILSFAKWTIQHIAPVFVVTSPITSFADQIYSMNKNRSSAGFSLDVPLIMLVASILKVFYWYGARYDLSLLAQASLMIFVQILVLHVALTNRPAIGAQHSLSAPFADIKGGGGEGYATRPFRFWQWRSRRPYWEFLAYYSATLALFQLLIGTTPAYVQLQGIVALSVEAILPLPQILENQRSQSCKGFRLSVLINWLLGDTFKMTYFFLSDGGVPWAFKMCGLFQSGCDLYLGVQYLMYDYGRPAVADVDVKDIRLA